MAAPFHLPSKEKGWADGRSHSSRNHSSTPASTVSLSIGRGDAVRTARVPLLYQCRYAREKLSVRESDRRCSPLAFCPRRISVGRTHHYRKRMYSIRRFRTKLTFRRNILLCCVSFELSCCCYSLRRWGRGSIGVIQEPRHRLLLLVYDRTARRRELPPQPTCRGTNTRSLWRPRPLMVANH